MNPLTCQAAVRAASDQLAGLLSGAERGALEDHLAGCDSCSCLMDQLRSTTESLRGPSHRTGRVFCFRICIPGGRGDR